MIEKPTINNPSTVHHAVLDDVHVGDIHGAFGSISANDHNPNQTWRRKFKMLLAIMGPGLIVMVGDNDAGAFATYTQAGQDYGTTLLWTLLLLVPVLYINQEMVLRLGVVTGVGHARLIFERFGKFWGAFSVIDLFVLNALTIVTEFIGISLGLDYLGVSKIWGLVAASVVIMGAATTGSFRRFERFAMLLVLGSLLLIPVLLMVHPPISQIAHDLVVPALPAHSKLSDIMLLIIAIVGTTIAPWQLFFQQSYVIDKRITPRYLKYARIDLWLGILIVIVGAVAMMAFCAQTFGGTTEFGHFVDAGAVASGIQKHIGHLPAILFAIALIDACIIGAAAVSLSTAYALGDVLSIKHSLHRKTTDAKGFYAVYCVLIAIAAALVLMPNAPLGLLTNLVQTLAGVLLPSATVFLLLLCNDKDVLGPWVNSKSINYFSGSIVAVLVMMSIILTASVLFPSITGTQIVWVLIVGMAATVLSVIGVKGYERIRGINSVTKISYGKTLRETWRMPPLNELQPAKISLLNKVWMIVLRAYLVVAAGMLIFKMVQLTIV